MPEEWRPVVGYEGLYEVSNLGRVMQVGRGRARTPGRILRQERRSGYLIAYLSFSGLARHKRVHRLVLEAFVGCRPGLQGNHLDGVKTNNQLSNLEWCTPAENGAHATRLGLTASGDRNGRRTHPERYWKWLLWRALTTNKKE